MPSTDAEVSGSRYLPVFYAELPPDGDRVELGGDEGQHAVRARRLRVGERLRIADMAGKYADCVVEEVAARSLQARIEHRGEQPVVLPRLVVAQALPKGDRASLAVELLTETGVDEIVPWQAAECVSRWADGAKAAKGREKWQVTAREAAKQSRRTRVPVVSDAVTTDQLAARVGGTRTLVLHESADEPMTTAPADAAKEVLLVVGPEGGIAANELQVLQDAGAQVVRLGPEVLRTSTAGAVALSLLAAQTGRWLRAPRP